MSKKRRGEESAESNSAGKKAKDPEFNGTAFKAMLKEPSTAAKGESVCTFSHIYLHISVRHVSGLCSQYLGTMFPAVLLCFGQFLLCFKCIF